jgi:hypothetical protein
MICEEKLEKLFVFRHIFQLFVKNRFVLNLMFSGKSLITPEPRIGKFQICAEMKVNYPTNKENTRMDFSDNFHNIKYFVQVDHIEKNIKYSLNFSRFTAPKKPPMSRKISQLVKTNTNTCQIQMLKFQVDRTITRFRI